MKNIFRLTCSVLLLFTSCVFTSEEKNDVVAHCAALASSQYSDLTQEIEKNKPIAFPHSTNKNGHLLCAPVEEWTSGFFPGSLWYMHQLTGEKKWKKLAKKYTEVLDSAKYLKWHHDIGFIIGCSFLNGLRDGESEYLPVILEAAKSLTTRYRATAGVIQSWEADKGWQSSRQWMCPVVIDNLMNLELLFEATHLSGDSTYHNIAVNHANTTLINHFRPNASSYHVVDYNPISGEVRSRETAQGYNNESAWARGQAWGLYGYTVCYRYTKNQKYLDQAQKIYLFIFTNRNLPCDLIPYWDYNALNIPNEPRDASAAAITASALYELFIHTGNKEYQETADKIIKHLCSPQYLAKKGENGYFILKHSVGSMPHNSEVDAPLNYADYYFLEALTRKMKNMRKE